MRDRLCRGLLAFAATAIVSAVGPDASAALKLNKGEHICFIGNNLADRMQHDGYTEAYLQAAFPAHALVIRNLGFCGDRVDHRPRAHKAFGDAHHHLSHSKADVIFAFFGYNESFDNKPDDFKKKLTKFLDDAADRKYNGKSAPRVVLFSPIAHENLNHPSLPTGQANNKRLAAYTKAMEAAA
ncbi:MAG: SGNH/GDSL hydrolase family protein, partial [Phycisphaeraceae bacterium]|nr:SGNH/GDSL hydrolase family protein [Phycisphaeraceae bacterium]